MNDLLVFIRLSMSHGIPKIKHQNETFKQIYIQHVQIFRKYD